MKKYLLTALLVLGFAAVAHASPVGLTSEADLTEGELWADNNIGVSLGFVVDGVSSRGVDVDSGEFEMDSYVARLGLSIIDRFNVYIDIGQMSGASLEFVHLGDRVQADFDDETIYGLGANVLIYRWDNGLEVGAGASFRSTDLTLSSAQVAGNSYTLSEMSDITDGDYEETQLALEVAWRTDVFSPYAGIKLSDVEVDCQFTADGQQRSALNKNAADNIGLFVGLSITPQIDAMGEKGERLAINLEGRFVDEEAFSAGVTYKF